MRLRWLFALLAIGLQAGSALAAERTVFLEVVVNGHPTGMVGEFIERDGILMATPADLRDLGLKPPPGALQDDATPIPLSDLPGIKVQVQEQTQRLEVTAQSRGLIATKLGVAGVAEIAEPDRSPYGAAFNYDVLATRSAGQITGGGLTDFRLFGPYGVFSSTGLYSFAHTKGQEPFARLDTTWTYSDPESTRRYRLGDVITGGLGWTRPIRLGGAQITTDFALRPDLVTFPIPSLAGETKVPSSVDILVNGVRQISQPVPAGPFQVQRPPLITGAGEVSVAVTDALGRQTVTTVPFYASSRLLSPGLSSYSVELGNVRQDYSGANSDYGPAVAMSTVRHGVTDWLTVEGHSEAMQSLSLLGFGATARLWTLGTLSVAAAGSDGGGPVRLPFAAAAGALPRTGSLVSVGVERQSRTLNLSFAASFASPGFRDLAAATGTPYPRSALQASLGVPLGQAGSIGAGFVSQHGGISYNSPTPGTPAKLMLATANYSVPLTDRLDIYATAYKDLHNPHATGAFFGISLTLGPRDSVQGGASIDNGRSAYSVNATRSASQPGELGIDVADTEGWNERRTVQTRYISPWGQASAGVEQNGTDLATQLSAQGGIVLAGGSLFFSNRVDDSFAVVSTGDAPDVGVLYENRPVGRTGSDGKLLVPFLRSYQRNTIALDPADLPPDVTVATGSLRKTVSPADRAGVWVDFGVKRSRAALVRLADRAGKPLALGSTVQLEGSGDPQPVGYDGEVYLTDLGATNALVAQLPSGGSCKARFAFKAESGELPTIGPVSCQ
jgi:outer membrane usher protein